VILLTRPAGTTNGPAATDGRGAPPLDGEVRYYKALPDFINCTFRYQRGSSGWRLSPRAWLNELKAVPRVVIAELNARDYPVAVVAVLAQLKESVRDLIAWIRRPRPGPSSSEGTDAPASRRRGAGALSHRRDTSSNDRPDR
jgi:hypothetical protein